MLFIFHQKNQIWKMKGKFVDIEILDSWNYRAGKFKKSPFFILCVISSTLGRKNKIENSLEIDLELILIMLIQCLLFYIVLSLYSLYVPFSIILLSLENFTWIDSGASAREEERERVILSHHQPLTFIWAGGKSKARKTWE